MKEQSTDTKYRTPITVNVEEFDALIGQVFAQAELLGLNDRQALAYRSQLRQLCWNWYNAYVDNPSGLADPSKQARIEARIEQSVTYTNN